MREVDENFKTVVIDIAELKNGTVLFEINHNLRDSMEFMAVLYDLVKRMEYQPADFNSKNFNL